MDRINNNKIRTIITFKQVRCKLRILTSQVRDRASQASQKVSQSLSNHQTKLNHQTKYILHPKHNLDSN